MNFRIQVRVPKLIVDSLKAYRIELTNKPTLLLPSSISMEDFVKSILKIKKERD